MAPRDLASAWEVAIETRPGKLRSRCGPYLVQEGFLGTPPTLHGSRRCRSCRSATRSYPGLTSCRTRIGSTCVQDVGRLLVVLGVVTTVIGGLLVVVGRLPWLGRLPGDFVVQRGPVTFYFPLVTS